MRHIKLSLITSLAMLATSCVGQLEGSQEPPVVVLDDEDQGAAAEDMAPARDMAPVTTQDMGSTAAEDMTPPGEDMSSPPPEEDMASPPPEEDMSPPAEEDMAPEEPVYENDCASGPLAEPIAGCRPAPLPSTGDPYEDCVRRINQLRWECQCLPPLERWHGGEQCADEQAAYDAENGTPHGAYQARICTPSGRGQNECPGWGSWSSVISGCLQQMWDEGPGEPFSEHGHYLNMTNPAHTKVACGEGGGWFIQNFR